MPFAEKDDVIFCSVCGKDVFVFLQDVNKGDALSSRHVRMASGEPAVAGNPIACSHCHVGMGALTVRCKDGATKPMLGVPLRLNSSKEILEYIKHVNPNLDISGISPEMYGDTLILRAGSATIAALFGSINPITLMDATGAQGFGYRTRMYPCPKCGSQEFEEKTHTYACKDRDGKPCKKTDWSSCSQLYYQKCKKCGAKWHNGTKDVIDKLPRRDDDEDV